MLQQISTDIIVVGAGISGLASSYFLTQGGQRVVIIEKSKSLGGTIKSERIQGFLAEYGPNSVLDTHPAIGELLAGIGLKEKMEYANDNAKNRYIVRNGRLCALPMGPGAFLRSPLFSARAKLRLCLEPFIGKSPAEANETLAQFVVRRLGQEFLDYAIDPFVAGVYAGLPEQLSVKSAFPKLYALEQEYGGLIKGAILGVRKRRKRKEVAKARARMFSFGDGLSRLIETLREKLPATIHSDARICAVRQNSGRYEVEFDAGADRWRVEGKALLFTIPAYAYAELPIAFDFPVRTALTSIYYPPVTVVYYGFRANPSRVPLDGFGFLVPKKEKRAFLGTLWSSAIFSGRTPEGGVALTTFVGGSRQPDNALLPDGMLDRLVRQELHDLMGIEKAPDVSVIYRVPQAIPQYKVAHQQIIEELAAFENSHPGLYLRGNFRGGISMGDVIKESQFNAQKILEFLANN
jgi:oxygen-dependent protoporphyrinogen oxidase